MNNDPAAEEPASDVLAAEEFGVPDRDPALRPEDPPTDVLAAEEFGVPAPDPALHHELLDLPPDPVSDAEPHDVLAAEEFAMPAPDEAHLSHPKGPARPLLKFVIAVKAVLLVGLWLWRRRRGRKSRESGAEG